MATISGRTFNHDGTRRWPACTVYLIIESTGVLEQQTTSNGVGFFQFTTADTIVVYTLVADAAGVRAGGRSGITAV